MNRAPAQRFEHTNVGTETATEVERRALRVAVDTTPLLGPRTGIGSVVAALTDRLAVEASIDLTGYVVSWRGSGYRSVVPRGAQPLRLRFPARVCHRMWRRFDVPRLPGGFDVVHGTNYVVPPNLAAVSLVSVHDLTSWWYPELVDGYSRANPQLLRRAIERGAHIQTGAKAVAAELLAEIDIEPERIHVVVNGFDRLQPGDSEKGRSTVGGPYVLAIGTIEPRKDYVGLIEAMTEVWGVHPEIRLVVVGGDGWGVEEFNTAVERAGAADRVLRCGYVSDIEKADLMAGAELLVYPSVYEGFGLPVLEAMDAGLPVVSTKVPAIAEVAGDAAVLVPVRSPIDLAEAIIVVLEDDDCRRDLRTKGLAQCRKFSWDRSAAEFVELYHRLVSLR